MQDAKRPRGFDCDGAASPTFGFITIRTRVPRRIYGCDSGGASAQSAASSCATGPASAPDAGRGYAAKPAKPKTIYEIELGCMSAKYDRYRAYQRKYMRTYNHRPDVIVKRRAYTKLPHVKAKATAYRKKYRQRPEVKERKRQWNKEYSKRPEVAQRIREYRQQPHIRLKAKLYYSRPEVTARRQEYYKRYAAQPHIKARLHEQHRRTLMMDDPRIQRILRHIQTPEARATFIERILEIAHGEPQWTKYCTGKL